jgi:hypothetical protein
MHTSPHPETPRNPALLIFYSLPTGWEQNITVPGSRPVKHAVARSLKHLLYAVNLKKGHAVIFFKKNCCIQGIATGRSSLCRAGNKSFKACLSFRRNYIDRFAMVGDATPSFPCIF